MFVQSEISFLHTLSQNCENDNPMSVMSTGNGTICEEERTHLSNYLYLFVLGMFINGFGGTILFSLGIVLIDSNVPSKTSPLYQGILTYSITVN